MPLLMIDNAEKFLFVHCRQDAYRMMDEIEPIRKATASHGVDFVDLQWSFGNGFNGTVAAVIGIVVLAILSAVKLRLSFSEQPVSPQGYAVGTFPNANYGPPCGQYVAISGASGAPGSIYHLPGVTNQGSGPTMKYRNSDTGSMPQMGFAPHVNTVISHHATAQQYGSPYAGQGPVQYPQGGYPMQSNNPTMTMGPQSSVQASAPFAGHTSGLYQSAGGQPGPPPGYYEKH